MQELNLIAAAPEIVLLAATCLVLMVDLFVPDDKRYLTLSLTLTVLALTAGVTWIFLANDVVMYAFDGLYVTDPMASVLKLFAVLVTALVLIYSQGYALDRGMWKGELFTLSLFSLLGMFVMISANNLLVVYLGLELQSLSLYALVALRRDDGRATEAAMKYFVLGALASGFLLYGMSMLYGASGTLDINELARRVAVGEVASRAALVLGTVFLVAGLAFKFGVVPFHMWVPDVYEGAPTPVTMFISSAPKLAAFAITYRMLVEGLLPLAVDWQQMIALIAVASLILGNLAAIAQTNLKRMLAYSTIAQMGFMLLALVGPITGGQPMNATLDFSAAMFYVITYSLTTLGTFGMILLMARQGHEAEEISDLAGLNQRSPWYALVMLMLMFSLAGIPPTVGFYAKFVVLEALLAGGGTGPVVLAVIAVMASLIGAFYYLRIVKLMYFDAPAAGVPQLAASTDLRVLLSINGALVLVLGLFPQYLLQLCTDAMVRSLGG
ncbi:MAG TPA: NADH-quinone oxidoreductase subunit NuoN [Burkholderiaceae bacterium]|jgi:NADH-quinone oxidoreductase subunit N|nr:NADH-quinone oxidoreductase subunit NuoN [Burkholderiaceae bacterium]HRZ01889.1 NADH-quinone oxidoreductase subunit NuoN [Burkholderiaceae bacterium]